MVEAHGWITLRYSDYHSEEAEQEKFVEKFKQFLHKQYDWVLNDQNGQIGRLVSRNGLDCFTIDVQHNHPDKPFYPVVIFNWAAANSTGSYGMLYFHDDEDEVHHNEFQVFTLKRGKLIKEKDYFLSPYEEEVEKEYDEDNPPLD
jgi:hypothetical protein